jgi:hypothetical protein
MGVPSMVTGQSRFLKPGPRELTLLNKAKGHEIVWPQVAPMLELAALTYVYVIGEEDDGAVKIGVAKDPISRLRGMQTGNPRRLKVEHLLFGDGVLERTLHQYWEDYAIFSSGTRGKAGAAPNTEWFRPEVREKMFPVLAEASAAQLELVPTGGLDERSAIRVIREAHTAHGFVAKAREEIRLLAAQPGYQVRSRKSYF